MTVPAGWEDRGHVDTDPAAARGYALANIASISPAAVSAVFGEYGVARPSQPKDSDSYPLTMEQLKAALTADVRQPVGYVGSPFVGVRIDHGLLQAKLDRIAGRTGNY